MKFRAWLFEQSDLPDYGEIESIYDKARVAVQIVKLYNPKLIENISTIANLASGAYGLHDADEKRRDTIHVNVRRILNQSRSDHDAIFQIASTIIHEATHEMEREAKGSGSEPGPQAEEQKFKQWAEQNMEKLHEMFPELQS